MYLSNKEVSFLEDRLFSGLSELFVCFSNSSDWLEKASFLNVNRELVNKV